MANEIENTITILEAEKLQIGIRLNEQIKSIRNTLDSIESKLSNNEKIYDSDGFQGNSTQIDIYLTKFVAYERAIYLIKLNRLGVLHGK